MRPLSNNTTILTRNHQRQGNINNQVQRNSSKKLHYDDQEDQEDNISWKEPHRTRRLVSPTGEHSLLTSNNNKEV